MYATGREGKHLCLVCYEHACMLWPVDRFVLRRRDMIHCRYDARHNASSALQLSRHEAC